MQQYQKYSNNTMNQNGEYNATHHDVNYQASSDYNTAATQYTNQSDQDMHHNIHDGINIDIEYHEKKDQNYTVLDDSEMSEKAYSDDKSNQQQQQQQQNSNQYENSDHKQHEILYENQDIQNDPNANHQNEFDYKKESDLLIEKQEKIWGIIPKVSTHQFKWLFSLMWDEKKLIIIGSIFLFTSGGLNLVLPKYIGTLIDYVLNAKDSDAQQAFLRNLILILGAIVTIIGISTGIRNYCFRYAGSRVVAKLRRKLFASIIGQEIAFFDSTKSGELLNRLSSDTKSIETALTINVSLFARNFLQVIGGTIVLFILSWKMALLVLGIIPPLLLFGFLYYRIVKRYSTQVQDALAKAADVAEESFINTRTIKSFTKEERQSHFYSDAVNFVLSLERKLAMAAGSFMGLMMFLANLAIILVTWFGGTLIINGDLTIGSLTSFIIYTVFVAGSLGMISNVFFELVKAMGATVRVHYLLNRVPPIESNHKLLHFQSAYHTSQRDKMNYKQVTHAELKGDIQFVNVKFSYPTRKDNLVLNSINLHLRPNTKVALVGKSGNGKSTIASLIQRFYDVDEGEILLDGCPIHEIDPISLRENIGVVSQEPSLFSCSIRENILFGCSEREELPTQDEIEEAAKKANCHDFIMEFHDGYETQVGERGVRLSGGQKQRIAICRAILKNPKILLLDEALSSLDSVSEQLVQEALEKLMQDKTVLVIAHRLSTVKNVDLVCVINKGEIVEQGTHQYLLNKNGIYKQLVSQQILREDDFMDSQENKSL